MACLHTIVPDNDSIMQSEAAAFISSLPAGMQKRQETAVRKAVGGDSSSLDSVRSSRNSAFNPPEDVSCIDSRAIQRNPVSKNKQTNKQTSKQKKPDIDL